MNKKVWNVKILYPICSTQVQCLSFYWIKNFFFLIDDEWLPLLMFFIFFDLETSFSDFPYPSNVRRKDFSDWKDVFKEKLSWKGIKSLH